MLRALLMCKHDHFDLDSWWRKSKENVRMSKTFKRDMISGTYGMRFDKLFKDLNQEEYIGKITSFIVLHAGEYKLINSKEELEQLQSGYRITIQAIGVHFFLNYNKETRQVGEPWKITQQESILWFFSPKQLVRFDSIAQYEQAEVGDLVMYKRSHGLVSKIRTLPKKRWWASSSWSRKQVMVISGQDAHAQKLSIERPYKLIKSSSFNQSSPSSSSS